jgi:hypothetical protein
MSDEVINIDDVKKDGRRKSQPHVVSMSRLRELSCISQVDEMIRKGVFSRSIAEFIQERQGLMRNVGRDQLVRLIRQYRTDLERSGVEVIKPGSSSTTKDPLHELTRLQELFDIHCDRIGMEVDTEKQLTKLFSTTHKEMATATLMAVAILKEKKQLGLIGENARKSSSRQFSGRTDAARIAQDAQSRQKVLNVFELMLGDSELMQDVIDSGGISGMQNRLLEGDIPLDEGMTIEGIMETSVDNGVSREVAKVKKRHRPKRSPAAKKRIAKRKKRPISESLIKKIKSQMENEKK